MRMFIRISLPVLGVLLASGCIRDNIGPCPPLSVEVSVGDKNWSNIADVSAAGLAEAVDEGLPFKEYVSTVSYILRDISSDVVVASSGLYTIVHESGTESIVFPEALPFGEYELVIWGNVSEDTDISDDFSSVTLHEEGGGEADDIYHSCDTIDYRYDAAAVSVSLERTSGCLPIDAVHLPQGTDYSEKDISSVSSQISKGMVYSAPVSLHTELDWGGDVSQMRTSTCLGPSSDGQFSEVGITFKDMDILRGKSADSAGSFSTEPVNIRIERNTITVLRYDFDPDAGSFHISTLVDGTWQIIHDMDID